MFEFEFGTNKIEPNKCPTGKLNINRLNRGITNAIPQLVPDRKKLSVVESKLISHRNLMKNSIKLI